MIALPKYWFAVLFITFLLSTVMGCVVQTRGISREEWRAFRDRCKRQPFTVYWRELSLIERALLYPGILTFFITLIIGLAARAK